jgi:signal transduction histidine kinase
MVAHDLRQPLTVIAGTLEMLADKLRVEDRKMLARAESATTRLTEGLDSLLEGARLGFTGIQATPKPFPIAPLLAFLCDARDAEARKKRLTLRLRAVPAMVISDPSLLTSILDNLIGNAVKYTERGGILVGCRRRRDKLIVQVWDSGIGIPSNMVEAIFEEFRRLAPEGRTGIGLGLSIVRRTADLLGHPVTVRSIPGKGSCFSVELPMATSPAQVPENTLPKRRDVNGVRSRGRFVPHQEG